MVALTVRSLADIRELEERVETSSLHAWNAIKELNGDAVQALAQIKFAPIGRHPTDGHQLNLIEQVNQTFTYLVALRASRYLLERFPNCGGLLLRPGAHAPKDSLDIESVSPNLIGAETFSAVHHNNNRKLSKDLAKLSIRPELHRFIFFYTPTFSKMERIAALEKFGVEVFSVSLKKD